VLLHQHFQSSSQPLLIWSSNDQFLIVVDEKWPNF
jgi:hypothetical protein